MPKQTTWTGGSSSAWDTAGNWTNGVPGSTDTAVIDGAVDITGGTVSADEVERVYVSSTYTGALGSTGTPLELDAAQVSIDSTASGSTHYLHLIGTHNPTPDVIVSGLKTGDALYLSGTLDRLLVGPTFVGTLYLGNSASKFAAPKSLIMTATSATVDASTAANVEWESSGSIEVLAGTLNLGENVGQDSTMTVSGGSVQVDDWTAVTGDQLDIHGGTVTWLAGSSGLTPSSITTIRTINVYGGTFTVAANQSAYIGLNDIRQWGGSVVLESDFANVELNGTFERFAGEYTPPKQSLVTVVAL